MRALALADEVYLGPVNRADKIGIGDRFDTVAVGAHLQALGVGAHTAPTNALLLEKLIANTGSGNSPRVVAFFTNGSFDGIIAQYAQFARSR